MKTINKAVVLAVIIAAVTFVMILLFYGRAEVESCDNGNAKSVNRQIDISTALHNDLVSQVERITVVPKNSSVKQKKSQTADEELFELDLPDIDEDELERAIAAAEADKIWKSQDAAMHGWPGYAQVREELHKELLEKMDMKELSDEELTKIALGFRENFWKLGGCFSKTSYRQAYKARVLLEFAYERSDWDLGIGDELVETILATDMVIKFDEEKNGNVANREVLEPLLHIRAKQFEQIEKEVKAGRVPTIEDFLRGCDLAFIQQRYDKAATREVLEWLQEKTIDGGWDRYDYLLTKLEEIFNSGERFGFNVYDVPMENFPDEFRYGRRLPSFHGPDSRGAFLWGMVHGIVVIHSEGIGP